MTRLRRLGALTFVLVAILSARAPVALADDCSDMPTMPSDWCHGEGAPEEPDPDETPEPEGPDETASPPAASTPAPTPARTATPTRRPSAVTTQRTPTPTAIGTVEVPTADPEATPEIIVEGPIADEPLDVVEPAASASSWIFGFIVGLVLGGFIGRASWGLRRRRRQQIFG